jgi:hypothetical protein
MFVRGFGVFPGKFYEVGHTKPPRVRNHVKEIWIWFLVCHSTSSRLQPEFSKCFHDLIPYILRHCGRHSLHGHNQDVWSSTVCPYYRVPSWSICVHLVIGLLKIGVERPPRFTCLDALLDEQKGASALEPKPVPMSVTSASYP